MQIHQKILSLVFPCITRHQRYSSTKVMKVIIDRKNFSPKIDDKLLYIDFDQNCNHNCKSSWIPLFTWFRDYVKQKILRFFIEICVSICWILNIHRSVRMTTVDFPSIAAIVYMVVKTKSTPTLEESPTMVHLSLSKSFQL